ncbi:hypothetical protein EDB89DRAFT_1917859 [Lactarius sanguifluus]|nr:hypothetical protein EDB89DRAFT_1917859 [Lactarius sanguifluus]
MLIQFKNEFYAVKDLQAVSGFRWNDKEKLVTAPADVWDAYIKTHPHATKLGGRRFLLYDSMAYLLNDAGPRATGRNACSPGPERSPGQARRPRSSAIAPLPIPSTHVITTAARTTSWPPQGPYRPIASGTKDACTSASQRQKKRRVSYDQEMSEIVSAFAEMVDAMKSRLVSMPRPEPPKPSTDDLLTRAITALEQDTGLSDKALAEAAYCFLVDRDVARVYVTLRTPRARSYFLRQLETRRRKL